MVASGSWIRWSSHKFNTVLVQQRNYYSQKMEGKWCRELWPQIHYFSLYFPLRFWKRPFYDLQKAIRRPKNISLIIDNNVSSYRQPIRLSEGPSDIVQRLHNQTLYVQCRESLFKAIWFAKRKKIIFYKHKIKQQNVQMRNKRQFWAMKPVLRWIECIRLAKLFRSRKLVFGVIWII